MRARIGCLALAGATALAIGPGTASQAAATTTTWSVHPGGAITATAGKTALRDTTTGVVLTCISSHLSGTLKHGSGLYGSGIGAITAAAYHCSMPIGVALKLTPRGLPWHLSLTSYNAGTRVSQGTIRYIEFVFTAPSCRAVINGTGGATANGVVPVSYANGTGKLTIHPAGANLHWYHVTGCAGLVGDGDPATLSAAYTLSPAQTITSPLTIPGSPMAGQTEPSGRRGRVMV